MQEDILEQLFAFENITLRPNGGELLAIEGRLGSINRNPEPSVLHFQLNLD